MLIDLVRGICCKESDQEFAETWQDINCDLEHLGVTQTYMWDISRIIIPCSILN